MRILVTCVAVVCFIFGCYESGHGATAGPSGRYQLERMGSDGFALVDSETGRVWLLAPGKEGCKGSGICFMEVNRLRLTESGWAPELLPAQK